MSDNGCFFWLAVIAMLCVTFICVAGMYYNTWG